MSYSYLIRTLPRVLALVAVGFLALANGAGVAQDVDVEIGEVGESCWDRCNLHYGEAIADGDMTEEMAEAMFPKCVATCECVESGESVCTARD